MTRFVITKLYKIRPEGTSASYLIQAPAQSRAHSDQVVQGFILYDRQITKHD